MSEQLSERGKDLVKYMPQVVNALADRLIESFEERLLYGEKPQTHYDELRSMRIEEIENWFWWMHKEMMRYTDSRVFLHDWLRQEVSDG